MDSLPTCMCSLATDRCVYWSNGRASMLMRAEIEGRKAQGLLGWIQQHDAREGSGMSMQAPATACGGHPRPAAAAHPPSSCVPLSRGQSVPDTALKALAECCGTLLAAVRPRNADRSSELARITAAI